MSGSTALADDTVKHEGDHPEYHVELEPHGVFGPYHRLASDIGFGAGIRATIPIVQNGFIPSLNNNVGISFGLDFMHYSGTCGYFAGRGAFVNYNCDGNELMFPVTLQWNFFVARNWSVGGEPGIYIYHWFFDNYCTANNVPGYYCNDYPSATSVDAAFFLVGRYHFSEKASLTMRVGYPYISVGASFFL